MSSLQSTIYDHWPKQAWYTSGHPYRIECSCGAQFPGVEDWAEHVAKIVQKDFIDVTPIPALPPKAELKPLDNDDLDAWGGFIKDTCIKFGVDVRIAWKVAGEFVYGLEKERTKWHTSP